ncbi:MAG: BamA/TamA family outer membrane protein [Chitinophagaceae bacterium]|nr:BamA/TamA family outer membrane protein [Chitinophagaceae bacterium]
MNGYQQAYLKKYTHYSLCLFFFCILFVRPYAQDSVKPSSSSDSRTVVAGEQYGTSGFHQWLWGKHYRKEWTVPVNVATVSLDTVDGGLMAYESGGGRQSKSLKLKNPNGKEYVLRSIDKSFGKALPEIYQNTFIETIINDQVSIALPYAAITIPGMAGAARIYHTVPKIVFVPEQKSLGEFNKEFGNQLYILEQRPGGNWIEAANFGNSPEIVSTDKMLEKTFEESDHRVDQLAFIRARLFDIFVGDWGRHEDQWRWATFEQEGKKIYRPVPRDRDQAYTKFDGVLLSMLKGAAGAGHLQTFNYTIKDIGLYNFSARHLDRQAANETTREQWVSTAKELQQLLTNEIIESSVKQLPPEVFPVSGDEIISKLRSRRDLLVDYANEYYLLLAKEVEVVGTKKKELFEVSRIDEERVSITIYDINKEGAARATPFYSRTFLTSETKEIRLYGLGENDQYVMRASTNKGIRVRIIGGNAKDSYYDSSLSMTGKKNIEIYDDQDNDFRTSAAKLKLSESDSVHVYNYDAFEYNSKGVKKILFYNNEDRVHIGIGYQAEKQKWRKYPFASKQEVNVKYSLMEAAFSTEYKGVFTEVIGKWNLALDANYDWIRWINYFGIGNSTERVKTGSENLNYYRMRTRQLLTSIGINRTFGPYSHVGISTFYQTYDIVKDNDRFVAEHPTNMNGGDYAKKDFGGARIDYLFQKVNDKVLPTKGIKFVSSVSYTRDLKESEKSFGRFSSAVTFYVPLFGSFVYYLKAGGATLTGTPEFYQLNVIGGGQTLRGYRRLRFYGKSSVYGQNELQWIRNVRGRLFNGKAGLLGLVDLGRVWYPGEHSNKLHISAGGGFMLAPFKKVSVVATYAVSREDATVNFRFSRNL